MKTKMKSEEKYATFLCPELARQGMKKRDSRLG